MGYPNVNGFNNGPNSTVVGTAQALMGPRQSSSVTARILSATLAAGPLDLNSLTLGASYLGGFTNMLILTPASGGSTINTLDATNIEDRHEVIFVNASVTDPLIFDNLTGAAPNQFSNVNSAQVQIPPNGMARATYIKSTINAWKFG